MPLPAGSDPEARLLRGIAQHFDDDDWFHGSAAFRDLERQVTLDPGVSVLVSHASPLRRVLDRALRSRHYAVNVVLPLEPGTGEITPLANPGGDR